MSEDSSKLNSNQTQEYVDLEEEDDNSTVNSDISSELCDSDIMICDELLEDNASLPDNDLLEEQVEYYITQIETDDYLKSYGEDENGDYED